MYEAIFNQLPTETLLDLRLVCRNWENISTPLILLKCRFVCERKRKGYFEEISRTTANLIDCLKESPSNNALTGISDMHLKRLTCSDMDAVFTQVPFRSPKSLFSSIRKLEISNSSLKWGHLIGLLDRFDNLDTFIDTTNRYKFETLVKFMCITIVDIHQGFLMRYSDKRFPLKGLTIRQTDVGSRTTSLLKLYELTCRQLESFDLIIETSEFNHASIIERMDFASTLGLFVLKNAPTLRHLLVEWTGQENYYYFDDFFHTINILAWTNAALLLTELHLHFEWIFMSRSNFRDTFIPFIQRLENLKILDIRKIVMEYDQSHLLPVLRPWNWEALQTELTYGLLMSDFPSTELVQETQRNLRAAPGLTNCITSLRIAVSSNMTEELAQLIPLGDGLTYDRVTDFMVNRIWQGYGTRFQSFNFNHVVDAFKNVTNLNILDGPRFAYFGRIRINKQFQKMSYAFLGNDDLQLLLRNLVKLKQLRLRLRMSTVTDVGMCGLTETAYRRIRQNGCRVGVYPYELRGTSFSNLKGEIDNRLF